NLSSDATSTKYAVQGAMFRHYETKFFVTCAPSTENATSVEFLTNGDGYCVSGNANVSCAVLAILG
ncbi:hypothetical protein AAVH_31566, partial [Aphelenchoides avenae]